MNFKNARGFKKVRELGKSARIWKKYPNLKTLSGIGKGRRI